MTIKTLSPHYVYVPLTNPISGDVCASYRVSLYIWNGLKSAPPSIPTYDITKINAANNNGTEKINISRLVNDFIEFTCVPQTTTTVVNGDNQVWVMFRCFYDEYETASIEEVFLGIKGYGYFLEGENPQLPENKILITGDEFKVNRQGAFVLPIMLNEPTVAPRYITLISVVLVDAGTNTWSFTFDINFPGFGMRGRIREIGGGVGDWTPWQTLQSGIEPWVLSLPTSITSGGFEAQLEAYDLVTSYLILSNILIVMP